MRGDRNAVCLVGRISRSSLIGLDPGLTTEGRLHDRGSSSSKDMSNHVGGKAGQVHAPGPVMGLTGASKLLGQIEQASQLG